jgi:hypothetical protein
VIRRNGLPILPRGCVPSYARLTNVLASPTAGHMNQGSIVLRVCPPLSLVPAWWLGVHPTAGHGLSSLRSTIDLPWNVIVSTTFHQPLRGREEVDESSRYFSLTAGKLLTFHVPAFQGNHKEKAGTFSSWNACLALVGLTTM